MFRLLLLVAVLATLGASGYWFVRGHADPRSRFLTAKVDKGEVSTTINATGTIEPEEVVDIGAQVAGMIKAFGRDPRNPGAPIDYGSPVEEGTVLARIDESLYRAAVKQGLANLHQSEANVHLAEANLEAMKSKLQQTKRDWERVKDLRQTRALSEFDIDTAQNAYETAAAGIPGSEAALEAAKNTVEVNRAALETAQINLNYCTIVAPVKGVIVDRRVNIGQTVVSSLSAPSLFLLAKDLTRLQIWASVNEADIGQIHTGQAVTFRVAAFPGERFSGKVIQVRFNAVMTQNVVTYTVVIGADNPDEKLLPYMTATLDFAVQRRDSVLRVPNVALRWQPSPGQIAEGFRADAPNAAGPQPPSQFTNAKKAPAVLGRVWVVDGLFVRPVKVQVGLSDGIVSEIAPGELQEGTPVVVGETIADSADSSNPFAPKLPAKK
jgi:HlyD family secretion protein